MKIVALISAATLLFSPLHVSSQTLDIQTDSLSETAAFSAIPDSYFQQTEDSDLSSAQEQTTESDSASLPQATTESDSALAEEATEEQQPIQEPQSTEQVRTYYGECKLTAYCPCEKCCGKSPDDPLYGITASGVKAQDGVTVAMYGLPYGTHIYIEGIGERIVQDRGVKSMWVDIFCQNHADCFQAKYNCTASVWIIE